MKFIIGLLHFLNKFLTKVLSTSCVGRITPPPHVYNACKFSIQLLEPNHTVGEWDTLCVDHISQSLRFVC